MFVCASVDLVEMIYLSFLAQKDSRKYSINGSFTSLSLEGLSEYKNSVVPLLLGLISEKTSSCLMVSHMDRARYFALFGSVTPLSLVRLSRSTNIVS